MGDPETQSAGWQEVQGDFLWRKGCKSECHAELVSASLNDIN